jgi:hypothetical protein
MVEFIVASQSCECSKGNRIWEENLCTRVYPDLKYKKQNKYITESYYFYSANGDKYLLTTFLEILEWGNELNRCSRTLKRLKLVFP